MVGLFGLALAALLLLGWPGARACRRGAAPPPRDARRRLTMPAWRSRISRCGSAGDAGERLRSAGRSGRGDDADGAERVRPVEPPELSLRDPRAGVRGVGRGRLDGVAIDALPPEQRAIGILFQDDLLFPHLSVGENLACAAGLGARPARAPGPGRGRARGGRAGGFAGRDPATLTGGQRARVGADAPPARAAPRALLLDEPFGRSTATWAARPPLRLRPCSAAGCRPPGDP